MKQIGIFFSIMLLFQEKKKVHDVIFP